MRPRALDHPWIVRGHDDARAVVPAELAHQLEHVARGPAVEVRRRLVGEDHPRLVHDRPGQRDPLPLAAGEQIGPHVLLPTEAHALEQRARALLGRSPG